MGCGATKPEVVKEPDVSIFDCNLKLAQLVTCVSHHSIGTRPVHSEGTAEKGGSRPLGKVMPSQSECFPLSLSKFS